MEEIRSIMQDNKTKSTLEMLDEYAAAERGMTAFVFVGGEINPQNVTRKPKESDIVIAADSGLLNAEKCGMKPSIVVGDFDSFPESKLPKGAEKISVPAEKDFTDSMLAVEVAIDRGAAEILIFGGLSGRLDHTLSNMGILRDLHEKRIYAAIEDGFNRVRYIESTSLLLARSGYKYFSLIAAEKKVKGVSIEGGKYPLKNALLTNGNQYAVSNEIEKNVALISVKKGGVFVVESKDK